MRIDVDAARAARNLETPTVRFGGVDFALPPELPAGVLDHVGLLASSEDDPVAAYGAMKGVLRELFADEYETFMGLRPSMDDLNVLIDGVMKAYGTDLGESPASKS